MQAVVTFFVGIGVEIGRGRTALLTDANRLGMQAAALQDAYLLRTEALLQHEQQATDRIMLVQGPDVHRHACSTMSDVHAVE